MSTRSNDEAPQPTPEPADCRSWWGALSPARRRKALLLGASVLAAALPVFRGLSNPRSTVPLDARWPFVAGKCWLDGQSPYDIAAFRAHWEASMDVPYRTPFAYPPHTAVYACVLALFDWDTVARFVASLNVISVVALFYMCFSLAWPAKAASGNGVSVILGGALAALMSSIPMVMTLGQSSLMVVCCLTAAHYFHRRGSEGLTAVCVLGATVKPQISLLPIVALLCVGPRRPILLGLALTMGIAALVYFPFGGAGDYLGSLDQWRDHPANHYEQLLGVIGLLTQSARLGPPWPIVAGVLALAISLGILAGVMAEPPAAAGPSQPGSPPNGPSRTDSDMFLLALGATGALSPLQVYDFVLFLPMLILCGAMSRRTWFLLLPGLLCLVRIPSRAPVQPFMESDVWSTLGWMAPTLGAIYVASLFAARRVRKRYGLANRCPGGAELEFDGLAPRG